MTTAELVQYQKHFIAQFSVYVSAPKTQPRKRSCAPPRRSVQKKPRRELCRNASLGRLRGRAAVDERSVRIGLILAGHKHPGRDRVLHAQTPKLIIWVLPCILSLMMVADQNAWAFRRGILLIIRAITDLCLFYFLPL